MNICPTAPVHSARDPTASQLNWLPQRISCLYTPSIFSNPAIANNTPTVAITSDRSVALTSFNQFAISGQSTRNEITSAIIDPDEVSQKLFDINPNSMIPIATNVTNAAARGAM